MTGLSFKSPWLTPALPKAVPGAGHDRAAGIGRKNAFVPACSRMFKSIEDDGKPKLDAPIQPIAD
jgi:hypothetical protein